jgi:GTPase Era involved in 16S rRNA processing
METEKLNVMIIGKVSSGKSSLINSWVGAFVSCVSLNRETFNPIIYKLTKSGLIKDAWNITTDLKNKHESNQKDRHKLEEFIKNINKKDELEKKITNLDKTFENIFLPNIFEKNIDIYDFPGLGDAEDKNNIFGEAINLWIDKMDIVIFVVDATRAFIDTEEVKEFNRVKKLIEDNKINNSHYTYLGVIVNKYDDIDDEEIKEIYDKIKTKIEYNSIFRYSSHKVMTESMIKNGISVPNFMIKEFKKILKNGSIKNQKIDKYISNIEIENVIMEKEVFNYNNEGITLKEKYKILGDWDNFYEELDRVFNKINHEREIIILRKVKLILDSINNDPIINTKCKCDDFKDKCDHIELDCRLYYKNHNNGEYYKDHNNEEYYYKNNNYEKCYNKYKCYFGKGYFERIDDHINCFKYIMKDTVYKKINEDDIKIKISDINDKMDMLIKYRISLEKFDEIIKSYMSKNGNIFAKYLIYYNNPDRYIIPCSIVSDNLIKYYSKKEHIFSDELILCRPEFTSNLSVDIVDKLLGLNNIWKWIKNNYILKDIEFDLMSKYMWNLEGLFPQRKKLIVLAKKNVKELYVLKYKNKFNDIEDIFKIRIYLFIDKNINNDINYHYTMNELLFNDYLISTELYEKTK